MSNTDLMLHDFFASLAIAGMSLELEQRQKIVEFIHAREAKLIAQERAKVWEEALKSMKRHAALCGPDFARMECGIIDEFVSRAAASRKEASDE